MAISWHNLLQFV